MNGFFIRWLWPDTAQEFWNILLVIFTFLLAFCAYEQVRIDTAFLTVDVPTIETPEVELTVRNVGREPSGEGAFTLYRGYRPCNGNILEETTRITTSVPALGPGQFISHWDVAISPERFKAMMDRKCGTIVIVAKVEYPALLWGN